MTTPHVTEMRLRLEPVGLDPFVHDLDRRRVRRDPPSTPDERNADRGGRTADAHSGR
jgi:hypothetical protein